MSGEYVRGRTAPNLAALKLKKASTGSVVTDIASAPRSEVPEGVDYTMPPAVINEGPATDTEAVSMVEPKPEPEAAPEPEEYAAEPPKAPAASKKVKTSIRHSESKAERVRATYLATMRIHRKRSLSDWISDLLDAECDRLEQEYNGGLPFDDDPEIPKGRPLSS